MDEATFYRLADEVEVFWGVHLYARLVDDARPPRTDWYYVSVPRDELKNGPDSVLTILLHEWGHRTISPRTVEHMLIWEGIALSEGVLDGGDFLNLVCDVWVDSWYLRPECRWNTAYAQGMHLHLEGLADQLLAQFSAGRGDTLDVQRLAALFDLESLVFCERTGSRHEPVLPITREAWSVLTDEAHTEAERIRKVARMLGYLYPKTNDTNGDTAATAPRGLWGTRLLADGAGVRVEPLLRAWDRNEVDVDEGDLITLLGPKRGSLAFENRELDRLYADVARHLPRRPGGAMSGPARPSGSVIWRWGEPPRELDWVGTFSTFGLSVPGVTTLRKRWDVGGVEVGRGERRTICLVLDDSGSTWGRVNSRVVEAAVALTETARRWNDRVSAVIFSDGVVDAWPPTSDYAPLERRCIRMAGLSGGTRLHPALVKAHDITKGEPAVLTCLITDTDAADSDSPAVYDALARLVGRGPILLFAVGGLCAGWPEVSGVRRFSVDADRSFADQAIGEVSRARAAVASVCMT